MARKQFRRYAPGEVRDAIDAALRRRPKGASVTQVQAAVEKKLGAPVPPSSVRSYLGIGSKASPPRYERLERGRYRLVRR